MRQALRKMIEKLLDWSDADGRCPLCLDRGMPDGFCAVCGRMDIREEDEIEDAINAQGGIEWITL